MVDLHAHILPGIDDGAANLEESLAICEMAYQDGIRTIVATPHAGKYPNTKEIILTKTEELKAKVIANNIGINILFGSDCQLQADIFSLVDAKQALTINNSRYLLLDIPYFLMPPNIGRILEGLVRKGVIPIIGHPERCLQVQEDNSILREVVKSGAVVQITASSLTGKMGKKAEETAISALKNGLTHIIATDTHGINKRPPVLSQAVEIASKLIGKDAALAMVTTLPQAIIEDRPVRVPVPKKP
jgi:protein-tyrosine phosphatase